MITKYKQYMIKNIDLQNIIDDVLLDVNKLFTTRKDIMICVITHSSFLVKTAYFHISIISIKKDSNNKLLVQFKNFDITVVNPIEIFYDADTDLYDILKKYILNAYVIRRFDLWSLDFIEKNNLTLNDDINIIVQTMLKYNKIRFIQMIRDKEFPISILDDYDYLINAKNFDLI